MYISVIVNARSTHSSRWFSERLVVIAKRILNVPNLLMLIKQEPITAQKLGSRDFWRITNGVLNKAKSAISPLFNGP